MYKKFIIFGLSLSAATLLAEEKTITLDTLSVTGTKSIEPTSKISQSVAVVDEKQLKERNVMNINDALQGIPGILAESKNSGFDSRLIIRGAGLKAPYGVREIMVLRDGVPMTDPDSFTRFDFIDIDDMERVEVLKGPGSLEGSGSAGGVISVQSKSVFDDEKMIRIGFGDYGAMNHHLRVADAISDSDYVAFSATYRQTDNDWRRHNKFDALQTSLKYGHIFEDDSTLEAEISYNESNLEFPGSMSEEQFETFKETGEQLETQDPWLHTGRDSKNLFANIRYEKEFGNTLYRPSIYYNQWSHFHPVTGVVNEKEAFVLGTDQTIENEHKLAGLDGKLVTGVTLRTDRSLNNEKYKYADVVRGPQFPSPFAPLVIQATESDEKGELMEESDEINDLYGAFISEQLYLTDDLLINVNGRYDHSKFDISGTEYSYFDYAAGDYNDNGIGAFSTTKDFDLYSAKLGLTYSIDEHINVYAMTALGDQVPTSSELLENPELDASRATSFEVGVKVRTNDLFIDLSVYQIYVKDEVVTQYVAADERDYVNAGQTDKKGAEISLSYRIMQGLQMGGSYAYSDYTYDEFEDAGVDYSGNQLKYIPKDQYALFALYEHSSGFKMGVDAKTWGEYYVDDENTQKYEGYDLITDLMMGYTYEAHTLQFNVKNLFDEYYAVEVTKSPYKDYYTAAAPRTMMVSYRYDF